MDILLDTHMAIWFADGSPHLPDRARDIIENPKNAIYVSDVSMWEIAIKHAKRPDSVRSTAKRFCEACDLAGFRNLALSLEAVFEYEELDFEGTSGTHKDPFDRMLIAQAKAEGMLLVTHDESLALYGEPFVVVM